MTSPSRASPEIKQGFLGVLGYSRRALDLVWATNRTLAITYAALTLLMGILPAAVAYVAALIVDAIVAGMSAAGDARAELTLRALSLVALEGMLVAAVEAARRGVSFCQSLLRAQLGHRVNGIILEKVLRLELTQLENSEFYDKLSQARRGASLRPLSLVTRTFTVAQNFISLLSFGILLVKFSPWAVALVMLGGWPVFVAQARFSGDAFRMFLRRSPEARMQMYLETLLSRGDHAGEIKLFGLGPLFIGRYKAIFDSLYAEDRSLTIRREGWGFALGVLATAALYGAYVWIVVSAIAARITLGQMTMYLMLFRQGQTAVSAMLSAIGGMYEDNLYLSALHEFLDAPTPRNFGSAVRGRDPRDGIRFEGVGFRYPGSDQDALHDVSLHIRPGESLALVGVNGSGKTTLIKLLTRLYSPTSGRITLDGVDLREWNEAALRNRIGVIFQDFVRYQLSVGENIAVGDVRHIEDESRWRAASEKGMADGIIDGLPDGYRTLLGKWFKNGHELSGGQWQKVALSRAFMRSQADILVLDEPTAAMDAGAEAEIYEHFRALSKDRITMLISHRFSTVRMADQIVVLDAGRIVERGDHERLLELNGRYARLFAIQASGYR